MINISVEYSVFFTEESTQIFNECFRCEETIIDKSYQAVTMMNINDDFTFSELKGINLCQSCYNEVKHRFK